MRHKLLATAVGQRTFALTFETGDEILERLRAFARAERLAGSHFTAIGACSEVILGYFEWASRQYRPIPVHEQVEVSLIGDIALAPDGEPLVRAHVVVGKADGTAYGGHLLRATVRPTLELMVTESTSHLQRQLDPAAGIPLIRV
jgi:predicted DNA-binding protein with PD1-like motif